MERKSVGSRTSLGVRQRHRDTLRHSNLIQLQVRVSSDDRPGRKVDPLSHEVPPQSTFLALESRSDGLDWSTRLLHRLRDTGNVVVHVGGDVVLSVGSPARQV